MNFLNKAIFPTKIFFLENNATFLSLFVKVFDSVKWFLVRARSYVRVCLLSNKLVLRNERFVTKQSFYNFFCVIFVWIKK